MSDALLINARTAHEQGRLDDAARLYSESLRVNSQNVQTIYALGSVYVDRGQFEDAHRLFGEAVRLHPSSADFQFAFGYALQRLNRHDQALAAFNRVSEINPGRVDAHLRKAGSLLAMRRFREAVDVYNFVLGKDQSSGEAWHNRGVALSELKHFEEAAHSFGKALMLRPESAASWNNRGNAYQELKKYEEAARDHAQALAIKPDFPYARGHLVLAKLSGCDWTRLEAERKKLIEGIRAGQPVIVPFGNLMISSSSADQRRCAEIWMERFKGITPLLRHGKHYKHERIRVAYLSGDFCDHPVAILLAGVFEHHDRARFETYGLSFGPDDQSDIRRRVEFGLDHFIHVRAKSDFEVATMMRELEIDIAVDLMGATADCRGGIFAHCAVPVQVNFLGFPATMAVEWMDYIIADRIVISESERSLYSEKIVHFPGTYFPGDNKRKISPAVPNRSELGLPERGFVFCSFNNNFKISPEMFAAWMRILRLAEGSVLWLAASGDNAERNLKWQAGECGIDPTRLVFASFVEDPADHLARHGAADLFLDTLPCNAHTTASNALWAGLPVLTLRGTTFAGRVAASMLYALDLPEMVTDSLADYESLAVSLARDPARLSAVKDKLQGNRSTAPLFNTALYTRNLEAAFERMMEQVSRGEAPHDIAIGQER